MQYTLSPPLDSSRFFGSKPDNNVLDQLDQGAYLFGRGRDALKFVIENSGFKDHDEVLLPAFGCPSIVEAFLAKRMKVQFYRVTSSLDIDVDDIQQRVIPGKTKALLFIQYFGFLQDKQKVDKLKELGLVLIEDRTHALFSKNCNISADYSFASLRKLLPVPEGCLLWSKLVLTDNTYKSFIKRHRNKLSDINLTVFRTLALIVAGFYQRHPKQLIKWLTGNIF